MRRPVFAWLIPIAFVLWVFFVLASFFAVQKPFSAANALAIGQVLLDLLATAWLGLIGLGLGLWLLPRVLPVELPLAETLVFGTGLGWGVLGLLVLGLGLIGLFQPLVAYGVTLGLSAVLAPQLWRLLRQTWRRERLIVDFPNRLAALYLAVIGLLALLVALLPSTDWDGLFYHLTGPKLYLQAGRFVGDFDVPHFNFPALMEMLFAWAMLLRGDIAAKLLHTGFGLLLVGLVYVVTRRLLGHKAAWPAVLILASMPMLGTLAGWAYNDLALAFYQLASLYLMINYQLTINNEQDVSFSSDVSNPETQNSKPKTRNLSWLILSGIFAGLAMGLKYTSFVTPVVISGLILWHAYRVSRVTSGISHFTFHISRFTFHSSRFIGAISLAAFVLPALLVALPWYLKNWAFTGNPVYPFLFDLFDGQYWDSFRADWYASAGTGIGWQPRTLLALPWLLTVGVRDANYWDGRTGPLLLLFLPLVIWAGFSRRFADRSVRPAVQVLLIYVLAHFSFWTLGVIWSRSLWQSRLLLPGLVGLAPVVGWVWSELPRLDLPQFFLSRFIKVTIVLTLALTVIDVGLLTLKIDPLPYLSGLESREEYLTRRLGGHYAAMQQINENLPSEAMIVFLWEPRSYYCQRDCRPDSILDTFPHLVYQYGSAEAIARTWGEAGVTHVLIHRTGLEFMLSEQPEAINMDVLNVLVSQHMQQIFDVGGAYQVYVLQK